MKTGPMSGEGLAESKRQQALGRVYALLLRLAQERRMSEQADDGVQDEPVDDGS